MLVYLDKLAYAAQTYNINPKPLILGVEIFLFGLTQTKSCEKSTILEKSGFSRNFLFMKPNLGFS